MRKLVVFLLTIALTAMVNVTMVSASTVEITTEDKKEYLISQGIPEDFLNDKETQDIDDIYASYYGKTVEYFGTETVSLTETADPSDISLLGVIPSDDMMLKITHVYVYDASSTSSSYFRIFETVVYVDYRWYNGKPFFRLTDAVSVNWDSSIFLLKPNSFQSTDYLSSSIGDQTNWIVTNTSSDPEQLNQGGLGYSIKMGSSPNFSTVQKGTAKFTLQPRSNIYSGKTRHTSINVEYVHNQSLFNTLTIAKDGLGVTINLSGMKDSVAKPLTFDYSV